jgi:hypothetical protein
MRAKACSSRSITTLEEETARHLRDWLAVEAIGAFLLARMA